MALDDTMPSSTRNEKSPTRERNEPFGGSTTGRRMVRSNWWGNVNLLVYKVHYGILKRICGFSAIRGFVFVLDIGAYSRPCIGDCILVEVCWDRDWVTLRFERMYAYCSSIDTLIYIGINYSRHNRVIVKSL